MSHMESRSGSQATKSSLINQALKHFCVRLQHADLQPSDTIEGNYGKAYPAALFSNTSGICTEIYKERSNGIFCETCDLWRKWPWSNLKICIWSPQLGMFHHSLKYTLPQHGCPPDMHWSPQVASSTRSGHHVGEKTRKPNRCSSGIRWSNVGQTTARATPYLRLSPTDQRFLRLLTLGCAQQLHLQ